LVKLQKNLSWLLSSSWAQYSLPTNGDSRMKKVEGHYGAKEKVGGNINVYIVW